jgi:hypothetical protein
LILGSELKFGFRAKMLEAARVLTWCNRRARVRIGGVVKVIRISNSYRFLDPGWPRRRCFKYGR